MKFYSSVDPFVGQQKVWMYKKKLTSPFSRMNLVEMHNVHMYGATARIGRTSGFNTGVRKVCPDAKYVHCVTQTEHLI
jgi:hypothetical protein